MDGLIFKLPLTEEYIRNANYEVENLEIKNLWDEFERGVHKRVPIRLNSNPKVLILDSALNYLNIQFKDYLYDPELMAQVQLNWELWRRFLLPGDHEHGLPEQWEIYIDFQNVYDASWFGAPLVFMDSQVPTIHPILRDDNCKMMLFDKGLPEPFKGELAQLALDHIEYYEKRFKGGWEFLGKPVKLTWKTPFGWTDGIFTVATLLRGMENLCMDILLDPQYVHQLLGYITEALINRMQAWLKFMGISYPMALYWFADDAIQILSREQYVEFVLPYHKKIYQIFSKPEKRFIHLCGNVQHLLPTIKKELGVNFFETGFPVDFGILRKELGPQVTILGGPKASLFLKGYARELISETEKILGSGVLKGKKFILQEGNNLPPCVDIDSCKDFYEFAKCKGILFD
ncbi:MAG: hypothetical protein N3G21_12510 [Candidatus Hydrogenedentes bacterium]|nr:hypothetical protein [Candidatus Hydrogenedentota bacterium]